MNYKQKLGYMALGAGILAVGIIIGQFVTPDIEAQNNGVFDKITCRELEVIDKNGKAAVVLAAVGRPVVALYRNGKTAVTLGANPFRNYVRVYGKNEKTAVVLATHENSNEVIVYGKDVKQAVVLGASESGNVARVYDPAGKKSFNFNAYLDSNELIVYDKSSGAGIGFYGDSNEVKQTTWRP